MLIIYKSVEDKYFNTKYMKYVFRLINVNKSKFIVNSYYSTQTCTGITTFNN